MLFSFLNMPTRYIKRELFADCEDKIELSQQKEQLLELDETLKRISKLNPLVALNYILKVVGYEAYVIEKCNSKGVGYTNRKEEIERGMITHSLSFPYFIYPNDQDDGDVETLMESAARRDLHPTFFDCFEDYEKCVLGAKDANGNPLYNTPNLKGKLHTYISSQQLTKKQRDKLGSGNWLFNNPNYWDLNVDTLQSLKDFLKQNLK